MKKTSVTALVAAGGFCAALALIGTWRFYGSLPPIPVTVSVTLWVMAGLCVYFALKVRSRKEDGRIGLDRSQLNPVLAAQLLVGGKASAWTGAIGGGVYVGMAVYVLPHAGQLVAAGTDAPGVAASALGGVALCAAGLFLENSCEVSPPTEGEAVG